LKVRRVGQADSAAQDIEMWVANVNGEPIWEAIVNGVVLQDRSGIALLKKCDLAIHQNGPTAGGSLGKPAR